MVYHMELFDEQSICHKKPFRWEGYSHWPRSGGIPFLSVWFITWSYSMSRAFRYSHWPRSGGIPFLSVWFITWSYSMSRAFRYSHWPRSGGIPFLSVWFITWSYSMSRASITNNVIVFYSVCSMFETIIYTDMAGLCLKHHESGLIGDVT